jgi:hypothetical protein
MRTKRKLLLFHLLFLAIFFAGFFYSANYFLALIIFNLVFVFYLRSFRRRYLKKGVFGLFVLSWLFLNSLYLYLSLIVSFSYAILLLSLGVLISYYYFMSLNSRIRRFPDFSSRDFFSWVDGFSVLSVFLASSFIYGLIYFFNFNYWSLLFFLMMILFFFSWQNISTVIPKIYRSVYFSLLFLLAITPLAWSLFFLPFNFNVLGIIISICYYFGVSFIKLYFSQSLTNKKIKYNLIFIIVLLSLILMTTKWI